MAYQVIARKWRPQRFDDVVGQQAVTRTLRNALSSGRLAQAFVFAGPRGVGKTTTARILARALCCEKGPTADPCGECDACVEIAEGRDIDVLEIDAATHTGVDNVREVIIDGLSIRPVRNRYKVFIIDEVHQLSNSSFNALLKSIEEPPPHVIFMMATTELDKIPETVQSRAQVYEFRTISTKAIAEQLRTIVDAEGITVLDESLLLVARDADGSMRDAQSKLDQVIAFTGQTIGPGDVSTVLGLVGRDLLLNTLQAVADEDAGAAFSIAAHAVEMGYDLRLVCRELARVVRDLLVLSVDASRANDAEIAGETERERLLALAKRFSREDLMRAFDLLTKAEFDIRGAAQPRYYLEMAFLRWIHLRKLVSLEELILNPGAVSGPSRPSAAPAPAPVSRPSPAPAKPAALPPPPASRASTLSGMVQHAQNAAARNAVAAPPVPAARAVVPPAPPPSAMRVALGDAGLKDALLAEIRKTIGMAYNTLVVQAQRIDVNGDTITLCFAASQKIGPTFVKYQAPIEALALKLAGRKMTLVCDNSGVERTVEGAPKPTAAEDAGRKTALKERAMADESVQALFEVFPAEIRDVEEM
ncbi:MAG: DNA polymerase III subunit gamma/tau [Vicinamibacterales bacterium]